MLKAIIVGASGYAGAKLAGYLQRHPQVELLALTVSEQSLDVNKLISDNSIHPNLKGLVDLPLLPVSDYTELAKEADVVFLATEHRVSHDLAPIFLQHNCTVFDLSGAYRVPQSEFYTDYYGFEHQHHELLNQAIYGLAEWNGNKLNQTQLIAVPGCYPTVSQIALKPLIEESLLDSEYFPIINATSGVSGAGRKATMNNSFCEVSLKAYGVFNHRHQPEIEHHLNQKVIFTPHLGNFKQGIHATITCKLKQPLSHDEILKAYQKYYQNKPLIRVYEKGHPELKSVVNTPFCDIGFSVKDNYLIIIGVEDNLLKGAASQAIQCMNMHFGFDETTSLL